MKILFCSHTGAFSGGAEKSMLFLIKHLIAHGNDVLVNIPDSKNDFSNELNANNIPFVTMLKDSDKTSYDKLNFLSKLNKVLTRLFYILKFRNFIIKNDFDVIYLNTIRTTSELIASKLARKKTVIHLRGFDTKSKFRYKLLKLSSKVIVLNSYAKFFISNYVAFQKVSIIPNGVRINEFREKKFNQNINIIHVGSYNFRKGSDFIFKSLRNLLTDENINFYHVGKSIPEDEFSNRIIEENFNIIRQSNFHELGYLANDKLIDLLDKMNIFLLPSRIEGLPRTVLEAMERGLVSIISDIPEHDELVTDYKTGLKINFDKVSEINKIQKLLINSDLLSEISKNSRKEAVYKYDILKINNKILSLIKKLNED